jgi:hypothetical protein
MGAIMYAIEKATVVFELWFYMIIQSGMKKWDRYYSENAV